MIIVVVLYRLSTGLLDLDEYMGALKVRDYYKTDCTTCCIYRSKYSLAIDA